MEKLVYSYGKETEITSELNSRIFYLSNLNVVKNELEYNNKFSQPTMNGVVNNLAEDSNLPNLDSIKRKRAVDRSTYDDSTQCMTN